MNTPNTSNTDKTTHPTNNQHTHQHQQKRAASAAEREAETSRQGTYGTVHSRDLLMLSTDRLREAALRILGS